MQHLGADAGVSCDKAQHGGHVGVNHARTFGNAAHMAGLSAERKADRRLFDRSVGRHDGAGCGRAAIWGKLTAQRRHAACNRLNGQRLPDDAGRSHNDVLRRKSEMLRRALAHLQGLLLAVGIAGVGVAAVADNGLRRAVGNVAFRDSNGRALHLVERIDAGRRGRLFAVNQSEVFFGAARLDAAVYARRLKAQRRADSARYFLNWMHKFSPFICVYGVTPGRLPRPGPA